MNRLRIMLGAVGVLIAGYGAWRIVSTARLTRPRELAEWLFGALLLHDALFAPAVAVIGAVLGRLLKGRAPRLARYLAGALLVGAMVTVVAVPLIHRRGHTPAGSTLEARNYGGGLSVVLGVVLAAALVAYGIRTIRDRG